MPGIEIRPLRLPPPFALHRIDAGDVLEAACALAPDAGAGTLVLAERPGLLALAVVLEPEQPLAEARLAFLVGMAALADALAAHCPPERPVRFVWPDEIRYDRSRLGGGRLAIAPGCAEDALPDWMVFAAELIADRDGIDEPGRYPDSISLAEDQFAPAGDIVESFASYLMLYFDRWTHEGIEAVTNRYLMRIDPPLLRGQRRIEGDALVEISHAGATRRIGLTEGLAASTWRGAGGPRL
ncbi:biotin/lipoate--protein ligase family protein [Rhodovulum strictum]|nr:biotin/lipoate--protein ligase family protein [Rhodovulum strictum]